MSQIHKYPIMNLTTHIGKYPSACAECWILTLSSWDNVTMLVFEKVTDAGTGSLQYHNVTSERPRKRHYLNFLVSYQSWCFLVYVVILNIILYIDLLIIITVVTNFYNIYLSLMFVIASPSKITLCEFLLLWNWCTPKYHHFFFFQPAEPTNVK